ncbi:MAG: helix-turn-helix domain-containing protein [Gammaproteobacteria bacterium]
MSISARKLLARNIKLNRTRIGWSQETLAELSGLHRSYIGAIERGEHNIGLDNIERLANTFGIHVLELIGGQPFTEHPAIKKTDAEMSQTTHTIHKRILIELLKQSEDSDFELALLYLEHNGVVIHN